MLEGYNFLRRHNVIANIEALDLTLLKCVGELLYVIHNDQIVADV